MKYVCWSLLLWFGSYTWPLAAQQLPPPPASPRQVYLQAASTLLHTYLQEQHAWNHYFTTIAPEQPLYEQIPPQQTYRRFLAHILAQWRQLPVVSTCQSTHLLYELAFYSYSVAADFRLTLLYADNTLLRSKPTVTLAEERTRHYTTLGNTYFKKAASLAQASHCMGSASSK